MRAWGAIVALLVASCGQNQGTAPSSADTSIETTPAGDAPDSSGVAVDSAALPATSADAPTLAPYANRATPDQADTKEPDFMSPELHEFQEKRARKHTQIGTFDDWVKEYAGLNTPETKRPPPLRVATDLGIKRGLVVFTRAAGIFSYDFETNAETHLRSGGATRPRFSPDGKRVFYVGHSGDFVLHIRSMDRKGGDDRDVTGPIRTHGDGLPYALSHDGHHLAYVSTEVSEDPDTYLRITRIHLVDLRSGKDETIGPPDDRYVMPWFSSDSDRLFFVVGHWPANGHVGSIDLATHELQAFPNADLGEFNSPFSLGDRVVFTAGPATGYCCKHEWLFSTNRQGTDLKPLGAFEVWGEAYPVRSPRGTKIAIPWTSRQGGAGADYYNDITLVDADGNRAGNVTAAFPRPFYSASSPSWAPDDHHLAFDLSICPYLGCELGQHSIVVVDADHPKETPAFLAYGANPEWSPEASTVGK